LLQRKPVVVATTYSSCSNPRFVVATTTATATQIQHIPFAGTQIQHILRVPFAGTQIQRIPFAGTQIQHIPFAGTQIQHIPFAGTQIQHIRFAGTQIQHIRFAGTQIQHIRFAGTQIQHIRFAGTQIHCCGIPRYSTHTFCWYPDTVIIVHKYLLLPLRTNGNDIKLNYKFGKMDVEENFILCRLNGIVKMQTFVEIAEHEKKCC
jgi:hypothetical protein